MSEPQRKEPLEDHACWYVRRGSAVQGPYTSRQISRYLLLGRVRISDRASMDGEQWTVLSELPDLVPDEMRDLDTLEGRARYLEARRRADERGAADSGPREATAWTGPRDRRRRSDNVSELGAVASGYGKVSKAAREAHPVVIATALTGVTVIVALLVAVIYSSTQTSLVRGVDCDAVAAPGVDWRYCVKDKVTLPGVDLRGAKLQHTELRGADLGRARLAGADLSYSRLSRAELANADLRSASLAGADLRGARLSEADLGGADLSAANLNGAALDNAKLAGVVLSGAIWTDGSKCANGSIGRCIH